MRDTALVGHLFAINLYTRKVFSPVTRVILTSRFDNPCTGENLVRDNFLNCSFENLLIKKEKEKGKSA